MNTAPTVIALEPETYRSHFIHAGERIWPETNCYIDAWVEVLHSLGVEPLYAAACTFAARFDAGQWTFVKFPTEDLRELFGIDVAEMNVWRPILDHIDETLRAGMLSTVETDGYWLPDTAGTSYHHTHTKTTIVPNRLDRDAERLEYFHNGGYHVVSGDDFRRLFDSTGSSESWWIPYVEQVRLPLDGITLNEDALGKIVRRHIAARPSGNPVEALAERVLHDTTWLAGADQDAFHLWAFASLRQCGATAELAADVCELIDGRGFYGAAEAAPAFRAVATAAKSVQFGAARLARGRSFDPEPMLVTMIGAWEQAMITVAAAAQERAYSW